LSPGFPFPSFCASQEENGLIREEAEMGIVEGGPTKGNVGRDRRLEKILDSVVAKGTLVQRKVGGSRAGEIGMVNFLKSPNTSTAYVMARDIRLTAEAAPGRRIVAAQDTTEVNFSGRDKRRKNLGPGGDGKTPGFFIHAVIAVDADDEAVIGPVAAHIWTRALPPEAKASAADAAKDKDDGQARAVCANATDDASKAETAKEPQKAGVADTQEDKVDGGTGTVCESAAVESKKSKKPKRIKKKDLREFEDKESARWLEGAVRAADVLKDARQIIVVGDRENDIYPVFVHKPEAVDFVVRASHNRALAGGGYLFDAPANWPVLGRQMVRVAPKGIGDKGRVAEVVVKSGSVTLCKPKEGRHKGLPKTITVNMVVAVEINPPEGVKALLWRLITTLPVSNFDDAVDVVRLYRLRWRIEQLFRTLKKDGLDLEAIQHEEASRIMKVAALGVVASCRIMQLVDARDGGERPATDAIPAEHIEDVAALGLTLEGGTARQKNPWKKGSLSWLSWIVARLGGWNCYYKKAGPKTMADGWKQLQAMLRMLDVVHGRVQAA
jgi:hypothetical protein